MATDGGVILTAAKVAEWRDRKVKLEREMDGIQRELTDINRRLDAVAILSEPPVSEGTPAEDGERPIQPSESMIAAVERIVAQAGTPMKKARLKKALAEEGFPPSRLGNYFYTVIARLKKHDRIRVASDGRVGPPPPP